MDGILSGLIGGTIAGGAIILGALTALLQNNSIEEEKSIEKNLEFFLGAALSLTALSFIHPVFEKIYHGSFEGNNELWSLLLAFVLGMFLIIFSRNFIQESLRTNNQKEQDASILLLLIFIKNIPEGFATGASMNIAHTGLSYTLMTGIGLHDLFEGVVVGICFIRLGIDPALTFVGAMFIAVFELVASIVGGYMSKEVLGFMPFIMAFAGGAMMSFKLHKFFTKLKMSSGKFALRPGLASGVIVTLVFIIWKELL